MLPSIIVDVACCWGEGKRSCYISKLAIKNRILRRTLCRLRKNLIGILQEDGFRSFSFLLIFFLGQTYVVDHPFEGLK